MRRLATGTALSFIALPVLLALPVASKPTAKPHPVATHQQTLSLGSFARPAAGVSKSVTAATSSAAKPVSSQATTLSLHKASTGRFSAVAVTWRAEPGLGDVSVQARGKQATGWTTWQKTDTDDQGAPDHGEATNGSGLLWLGESNGVELQVSDGAGKAPQDLQLRLIDPGTSAADASPAGSAPRDQAHADVSTPTIYSRAQWGANESYMTWTPQYSSTLKAGFLHHSVQSNTYSAAEVPALIRADYYYHAITRGWGDIGYNFLVDRFGRVWQGRSGDIYRPGIGAHTGGFNSYTFGISMIGNFDVTGVPAATQAAVGNVFAWKLALHHLDPYGTTQLTSTGGGTSHYPAGVTVTKPVIMGHRDVGETACPGRYGYAILPGVRARARALMTPVLANPALSTTSPEYGGAPLGMLAMLRRTSGASVEIYDDCAQTLIWRWAATWSTRDFLWRGSWDLRDSAGRPAQPGAHRVRITAFAGTERTTWDSLFQVARTAPAPTPPGTAAPRPRAASTFFPLSPTRLLDTRSGLGSTAGIGKLGSGSSLRTVVAGHAGVPSTGVSAVLLTLTARCASTDTWLSAASSDGVVPATAPVVASARTIRSMTTAVPLGPDGAIMIRNAHGYTDVTADVSGYYSGGTTGGRFHPVTPARVYNAASPAKPMMTGERRVVPIAGQGGVPSTATAVALQLTTIVSSYGGSIVLYGAGGAVQSGSTAEFLPGDTVRTQAIVQLTGGAIGMYSRTSWIYPILEVTGYYAPSTVAGGLRYVPLDPTQAFDTRAGSGPISSASHLTVPIAGQNGVPASGPKAVALSLRSFETTNASWLRAYPTGTPAPSYGVLWAEPGGTRAGSSWPALGSGGAVTFGPTTGSTQLIGDLDGYFTA